MDFDSIGPRTGQYVVISQGDEFDYTMKLLKWRVRFGLGDSIGT